MLVVWIQHIKVKLLATNTMKKVWKKDEIIERINQVFPPGKVIPRHRDKGHFYEIREGDSINQPEFNPDGSWNVVGVVYPSVTGKIQVLKDEGLINYKMNRAIDYFKNFLFGLINLPSMEEIDMACERASRVSQDILEDAGDIGTRIHNLREVIFKHWIKTGVRPTDFLSFIPAEEQDIRVTSALRALQKFCEERDYIPVAVELLVYSHKLGVAGTLDDLGLMRHVLNEGRGDCDHIGTDHIGDMEYPTSQIMEDNKGRHTCLNCGYQYRYEFVLMDLKTSNQFKDHYFFQVALYWWKLWQLLGVAWKPERCFILKVSKEDGRYQIEDLKQPSKLAEYCRAMIKTNEGVSFIKSLRKDNQKVVAPLMQL